MIEKFQVHVVLALKDIPAEDTKGAILKIFDKFYELIKDLLQIRLYVL